MEAALVRPHIDRLMHNVLGDPFEAGVLQQLLHQTDVDVGHRSRRETGLAGKRSHQHRCAQHFVVIKVLRPLRA